MKAQMRRAIRSTVIEVPGERAQAFLRGLPAPGQYRIVLKPLRYRTRPHLAAFTEFEERRITLQVPQPFRPFRERIDYGARRLPGKSLKFKWLSHRVSFRTRRQVLRFLYCHEWYHWYLKEILGRRSSAETACDRFALENFRRRRVTLGDARRALRRSA
jgi:hypothetical protein